MRMKGKKVVFIITTGYTDPELWTPLYRFQEEGAETIIAGPEKGIVYGEGVHGMDGWPAEISHTVEEVMKESFDLLFLPGGAYSPMNLRLHEPTLRCVRESMESGKMVCAICHAPQILISANVLKGKKVTCPRDMAIDVMNAGAEYMAVPAVKDGNLYTSVIYDNLPDLMRLIMADV